MKIEVLYSEICNLYGDNANIDYISKCVLNSKVYYTNINEIPKFVTEDVDLIYMGPMKEKERAIVISKLMKYKNRIKELIENNVHFLMIGNALEIFGKKIDDIDGLGIFNTISKTNYDYHHISCFLGEYDGIKIVGFQSKFSYTYNSDNPFIKVIHGYGFNDEIEGIHYKNFYGTYLIGPLLINNPYFTKKFLEEFNYPFELKYFNDLKILYKNRLKDFEDSRMVYKDRSSF